MEEVHIIGRRGIAQVSTFFFYHALTAAVGGRRGEEDGESEKQGNEKVGATSQEKRTRRENERMQKQKEN